MSDKKVNQVLYTADPTAAPVTGEAFGHQKADADGATWVRNITSGIPQTGGNPDSDNVDPATVWAIDVKSFNYIWDPVAGRWDREQRYTAADNMPDIEARTVLSFNMGYDGATWDRLRIGAGNADGVAAETLGLLKVLTRLTGWNGAAYDRLRSAGNTGDALSTAALGYLQVLSNLMGYNGASMDRLRSGADNADAVAVIAQGVLKTLDRMTAFNGTTWDRLRTTVDNSDAVASGVTGLLGVMARGLIWNGTNWQRNYKQADFNGVTSGNVGAASSSILAADADRKYLLIQNTHATQTLYINFGAAASPTTLAIIAGGNYEPLIVPTDEIFAYGSAAATTYVIADA